MREVIIKPIRSQTVFLRIQKVAAYCRVSTQQEIQFHSLEAQAEYFRAYILKKPGWEFVGIYADQASGRHNLRMKEFQNMMTDCRAGKINLILVKSISRLGRNTVQFLQVCEELYHLGVEVYFEVEKLHISDPAAVKMLTIYAGFYQQESESKSFATRWGILVRFQDGSSGFSTKPCYGYQKNTDGHLIPIPKEAAVVRLIYDLRQNGCSLRDISQELSAAGLLAPRGGKKWGIETIRKILKNEKYTGNIRLQKTYVADFFTGRQAENHGEYPQYIISNTHEAIIDVDLLE